MDVDRRFYQILDVSVSLESDSADVVEWFDRDYGRFKVRSIRGRARCSCFVHLDGKEGKPFVRVNRKVFPLNGHPHQGPYACQQIVRALFEEVREFLLLHAGVVGKDGQALILAGPPGVGKTTLVLALLETGYAFLADDFCPLHRDTGLVHPFPRSVWVARRRSANGVIRGKIPLQPDQLGSPEAEGPCRPRWLICLDPGDPSDGWCELEVGLKESDGKFLRDLRQIPRVVVESLSSASPEWRIRYPRSRGLTEKVRGILEKNEAKIWNVYRMDSVRPDFSREPVLASISTHEAAFRLMRELKGGPTFSAGAMAPQGSPARCFMELNELLQGVSCYRLSAGRLGAMRDRVLGVSNEP